MTEEQEDVLALFGVPGVGAKKFARLVEAFGSPRSVFDATDSELLSLDGFGKAMLKRIRSFDRDAFVDDQKSRMEDCGAAMLIRSSPDYPPLLNSFISAPPVLFIRGDAAILSHQSLAYVGTRIPSEYGINLTRELVSGTVAADMAVVSGMAAGIDAVAHRTTLDCDGNTVAVFGCSVDIIYPRENKNLYNDIIDKGCAVSHFPMGETPLRGNFPARNAVIVGLSLGTIVVEAPEKSGALITADLALRAGRKLFAVPGSATSKTSRGTNELLTRGARPVFDIESILSEMGKPVPPNIPKTTVKRSLPSKPLPSGLKGDIVKVLDDGPLHVDDISAKLGVSVITINAELPMLEMGGYVRKIPGMVYERV
ncbi:DNA-processing protein DprA [Candidatus Latescibacterota bacterium]